jgi:hypothetical protein
MRRATCYRIWIDVSAAKGAEAFRAGDAAFARDDVAFRVDLVGFREIA